ncbi:alpha/beta fold hydrolase [Kistimonas scapharcae]|uniref:Alpha/beta fold hydrolase n=1 Tax=Kistimonas scapharcae TaxID=1036133 RepID=A0ABP8VA11_9GAMM
MEYTRSFSPRMLDAEPVSIEFGQWLLQYQAFSNPANDHRTPVVFLSGAFQNFRSFRHEVEVFLQDFPVILLDLPSQGSNPQLVPDLSLEDMACLLKGFLDVCSVERINLIGISYGSLLASLFATEFPERIEKLLLSGTTPMGRPALMRTLEESLHLCREGRIKEFAAGCVTTMINHYHVEQTGLGRTHQKLLFRQVSRLDEAERERFLQNTQRLIDFKGFDKYPQCPTLVATGEYDHFTLPCENAAFALRCPRSTFALIHNADHMSIFARREGTCRLFYHFLTGRPLSSCKDFQVMNRVAMITMERRISPRLVPIRNGACILKTESGEKIAARIDDINFFGTRLSLKENRTLNLDERNLELQIDSIGVSLSVHILEQDDEQLRGHFIHIDLQTAERFRQYLNDDSYFMDQQPLALFEEEFVADIAG